MLSWWRRRRLREKALEISAKDWMTRHGRRARKLASLRSMDAYLLGDLDEQERWGRIREKIAESEGTDPFTTSNTRRPPDSGD